MAVKRRRIKFKPFRMTERFRNAMLVGLGVFLMAIFAVPFQGSCQRRRQGEHGAYEVIATYKGKKILYGEVDDMRRRWHSVFRQTLSESEALFQLAEHLEAAESGIRIPDAEVIDAVRSQIFARRLRVEYIIAETNSFVTGAPAAGASEGKRAAGERARAALAQVRRDVEDLVGPPLETAFKTLATERKLTFEETKVFTGLTAEAELRRIGDAPEIAQRVFTQLIGAPSEPLPIEGGWVIFRVVMRTRGFGPDGLFYPEEQGWVRQGFGAINRKDYSEVLGELDVTQADLEQTLREKLALVILPSILINTAADIPQTMLRARYRRDNTQALAAYFAMRNTDFAGAVQPTEQQLREFYDRYKSIPRTETRPGYLVPERVAIEYVLGRTADISAGLGADELRKYYEHNKNLFEGAFEAVRDEVRKRLAEETLRRLLAAVADRAAEATATGQELDLAALANQASREANGAFSAKATGLFAASDAEHDVPELRGGKLDEILFGERAKQYAVPGTEPKPGTHVISEDFACEAGRFFFRILERTPAREVPFDAVTSSDTREQLVRDYTNEKSFDKARETAGEYRAKIHGAAFTRFAEAVGTKPLEAAQLKPDTPIPTVGKPVPALYDQFLLAEVGDLGNLVEAGDRLLLGRLAARDEKGIRLELVSFSTQGLKLTYEPATYELQARYDADPYAHLPKPQPTPFDQVKGEIQKLLAKRLAVTLASDRIDKARAAAAGAAGEKPDLAAIATDNKLQLHRDVAVDLAKTDATPHVGKAAGFHDAVASLKPDTFSGVLSSGEGRFFFAVRTRDDKTAKIDIVAAPYEPLRAEAKPDDKDVQKYYDDHRDTAYTADDEIKDAPSWDALSAKAPEALASLRKALQDEWAKKTAIARATQVRDSLVAEAFRTVPAADPLTVERKIRLSVRTLGPLLLSKPEGRMPPDPELLAAVRPLKVGEVTPPVETKQGAVLALLAERSRGGEARAKIALFRASDYLDKLPAPSAEDLQRYYDAHTEDLRIPPQVALEYAFVDLAPEQRAIAPKLSDAEVGRYFEERRDQEYRDMVFDEISGAVRADLARQRAQRALRPEAEAALEALGKAQDPAKADLAALAAARRLAHGTTEPFGVKGVVELPNLGRIVGLAADLRDAKPGLVVPRVIETSNGYIVARVTSFAASRVPPLDEVRQSVVQSVRLEAARQAAAKAAEAFRAEAARTSFDKAAAKPPGVPKLVETELLDSRRFAVPGVGPVPALADAVYALDKPGLTPVIADPEVARSAVAFVTDRRPDDLVTLSIVVIRVPEEEVPPDEARKYYEAHKDKFRVPDQATVEFLAVTYAGLAKDVKFTDDELRKEYQRGVDAGEFQYRDPDAAPRVAYLPFEKARDAVELQLRRAKAKALLEEALKALRAQGAAAAFPAYADAHPGLVAGKSGLLDETQQAGLPIGNAPELAKGALAAKEGEIAGPFLGTEGAALIRRTELRPAHVPPFDEVAAEAAREASRAKSVERALAAAATVRERIAPDIAKANDAREAFRAAIEAEPIALRLPKPVSVVVSRPFYPLNAGWGKNSSITGLGEKPELVRAVFAQSAGQLTPAVDDPERGAAYVAFTIAFIKAPKPTESRLFETRYVLTEAVRRMIGNSWNLYISENLNRVQ